MNGIIKKIATALFASLSLGSLIGQNHLNVIIELNGEIVLGTNVDNGMLVFNSDQDTIPLKVITGELILSSEDAELLALYPDDSTMYFYFSMLMSWRGDFKTIDLRLPMKAAFFKQRYLIIRVYRDFRDHPDLQGGFEYISPLQTSLIPENVKRRILRRN